MRTLRIAVRIVENFPMERYLEVGHGKGEKNIIWWYAQGELHTEETSGDVWHAKLVREKKMDLGSTDYAGRYSPKNKILTLVCANPRLLFREVPNAVINALERRFPEAEELRVMKRI